MFIFLPTPRRSGSSRLNFLTAKVRLHELLPHRISSITLLIRSPSRCNRSCMIYRKVPDEQSDDFVRSSSLMFRTPIEVFPHRVLLSLPFPHATGLSISRFVWSPESPSVAGKSVRRRLPCEPRSLLTHSRPFPEIIASPPPCQESILIMQ